MEIKPYKIILDNLRNEGEKEIDRLLSLIEQESFYIDYKEVSSQNGDNKLSESDRKNYAKAISGFANTSGGILIWGVREDSNNFSKKKIDNPDNFVKILNNEVSILTLPAQNEVNSFAIKDEENKGFVITEIPKYYFSPVQIISKIKDSQYKYFIRSGSSFCPANHDILSGLYNRQRASKIINFWTTDDGVKTYNEDDKIINVKFGLNLQNKGLGVLRDIWVNFTSSALNIQLEKTPCFHIFNAWNAFGQAINLITKDNFKFAPQQIINPFYISLTIKKDKIINDAYIYISYGADQVIPSELDIKINKETIDNFIKKEHKNINEFLSHFGFSKNND